MYFIFFITLCVIVLPTAIAFYTHHKSKYAILVLNASVFAPVVTSVIGAIALGMLGDLLFIISILLLVVSFVFWVVALVWSVR